MRSSVKWNTGEPEESGSYLVTIKVASSTFVTCDYYSCLRGWSHWKSDGITAWCKLDNVKPYKEKEQ
jgi:hypothetical protein